MTWLGLTIISFVLFVGLGAVLLQLATLPGTWILLLLATMTWGIEFWRPLALPDAQGLIEPIWGWQTLVALLVIAVIAEIVETAASAAGAKAGGASRRGMIGALIGSVIGLIIGTFALWMLPIIGSIIGAVAGSALGAIVGELSAGGRTLRQSALPATGAAAGRLAGTIVKTGFALAMWIWMAIAVFV